MSGPRSARTSEEPTAEGPAPIMTVDGLLAVLHAAAARLPQLEPPYGARSLGTEEHDG